MPKLEELRERFKAEKKPPEEPGLKSAKPAPTPPKKKKGGVDLGKIQGRALARTMENGSKYWVLPGSPRDIRLGFGKHNGLTISEIAAGDPSYLDWMGHQNFPAEVMDAVDYWLDDSGYDGDEARDQRELEDIAPDEIPF